MLTIDGLLVLEFVIIFNISDIILAYQPMLLASVQVSREVSMVPVDRLVMIINDSTVT